MVVFGKNCIMKLRIFIPAGAAAATPPLGPLLGQYGINTVQFCKEFNELTDGLSSFFDEENVLLEVNGDDSLEEQVDLVNEELIVVVEVLIYDDRTFSFEINKPTTSFLLSMLTGISKGNSALTTGYISVYELIKLAKFKFPRISLYSASMMVKGTARAMGIKVRRRIV